MQHAAPPLADSYAPATFQVRGVAAPFTTPLLAGARVRKTKDTTIELVVANPSGSRGVYIVQWPGLRALCNPTVHDTLLYKRLTRLSQVEPAHVRDAALQIALDGYAGRHAATAAEAASQRDLSQRLLAHFLLVVELVERVEPGSRRPASLAERTPAFDRRVATALQRTAASVGRPAASLAAGLTAMGRAFAPVGVARDDRAARIPRIISCLEVTCAQLSLWLAEDLHNDFGGLGQVVANALKATSHGCQAMLTATRRVLADPIALLKRWTMRADDVLALAARCDWLLDGWERVCLIWRLANTGSARRAALIEMAQLLPVLPSEASDWTNLAAPSAALQACRIVSHDDTWRSGSAAFALTQRNESLRAMSL